MQCADEDNHAKSRSDEENLNFRPSPNFKHKKYLRSKFEEAMLVEANSTLLGHNKREKVNHPMAVASAAAQPPLPPNPPPPDTPPMIMNLKQEIVDDEYTCTETVPVTVIEELRPVTTDKIKTDNSEETPTVTMCRNFARGTCNKGTTCKFAHEFILSQLPGVYTFCRNFQNSVCSFPKCKFVHATVFEKEHFFRTGYLPPHTLAHLKEANVQQPPPQPPQPPQFEEVPPAELPPVYSNAPPPTVPCIPPVAIRYNAETGVEPSDPNIFTTVQPAKSASSPKREWCEIGEVSSSTCDRDSGEPLAKKCKKCASNELRLQLAKANVEKKARSNTEQIQSIMHLIEKNTTLTEVLKVFLTSSSNPTSGANGLHNIVNADKELRQWMTNKSFNSMLAKMMWNVDSVLQPDAS